VEHGNLHCNANGGATSGVTTRARVRMRDGGDGTACSGDEVPEKRMERGAVSRARLAGSTSDGRNSRASGRSAISHEIRS
jgi:hypothetical protein